MLFDRAMEFLPSQLPGFVYYWRLERLKSFDEFLERRFPESRWKAYYIMTIHEHLTRIPKHNLQQIGWTKAR